MLFSVVSASLVTLPGPGDSRLLGNVVGHGNQAWVYASSSLVQLDDHREKLENVELLLTAHDQPKEGDRVVHHASAKIGTLRGEILSNEPVARGSQVRLKNLKHEHFNGRTIEVESVLQGKARVTVFGASLKLSAQQFDLLAYEFLPDGTHASFAVELKDISPIRFQHVDLAESSDVRVEFLGGTKGFGLISVETFGRYGLHLLKTLASQDLVGLLSFANKVQKQEFDSPEALIESFEETISFEGIEEDWMQLFKMVAFTAAKANNWSSNTAKANVILSFVTNLRISEQFGPMNDDPKELLALWPNAEGVEQEIRKELRLDDDTPLNEIEDFVLQFSCTLW